ncbi:nocobactin polyketide synthase NbtC [Mycobacterium asiaticum]|uniref:Polyketide synthase n=1 Tax=Mycobacterium asiaticum TaxID=1790 RepID=A0A1A3KRN7_MYCAS|nr:nocobactin polyketide synthase NbtC [Mycobacterium asiaticum]OBJ87665.1 polyketide synthase [Mycobacterium asiaticum]
MTPLSYRLPNGSTPVLLSADTAELLPREAAALLSYATTHSDVSPQAIADMLFRTRIARKHRALAMVSERDAFLSALRAIAEGRDHSLVLRSEAAATTRSVGFVFPGQGSQRPGMGRLFYESVPAFRAEVDRCAAAFEAYIGQTPLKYLLDEGVTADDDAGTVQPALFTQMAGLAAMWRSFGVAPRSTIGHSQGEIAAAYLSGLITLDDAVRIVSIRSGAADEFISGAYAMAVIAADRETCEDLLARACGWAELSVVNSPNLTGISGDQDAVQGIVDNCTERGIFARVIRVRYPAHTSVINELNNKLRAATQRELENPKFLDADIECVGATLGTTITSDLPVDRYWFWNLRNTVRFDKAIATATAAGVDTFVELAEHPTLQLAIQENLAADSGIEEERQPLVVGTSLRTAGDLDEFTRNLVRLALHDLGFAWQGLGTEFDGPPPLPLVDFPNTVFNDARLWMPYEQGISRIPGRTSNVGVAAKPAVSESDSTPTAPRLLNEQWVRLSRRSLVPPRTIGVIDYTGECAELAGALCVAAADAGATAQLVNPETAAVAGGLDTLAVLMPQSPRLDTAGAAARVVTFFSERTWWPGVPAGVTDFWLVTVAGETVIAADATPDLVHAGASAGFRSVGAKYPGTRFRHLDLPATPGASLSATAPAVVAALHTAEESELAIREGGLYAKRVIETDLPAIESDTSAAGHILILGGTGKLGLEFCEHYAHRGAKRITLVNRSGETAAIADRLQRIRSATSADIRVVARDLSETSAIEELAQQGLPADLIIHAAVEYSGVELEDITPDLADAALRAKVIGIAGVLDSYPRASNSRVLLCSSVSATVGGRGLALYAAGNRMLDALAHQHRSAGADCISVQWGHWDVHLDRSGAAMLAGLGVVPMRPTDALAAGMARFGENVIVAAFDLERARSVLQTCGRHSLLAQLDSAPPPATDPEVQRPAAETGRSQRFVNLLAQAIGLDSAETIDTSVPMVAIGLDSLQALEFRRRVKQEFNHDLEVADLLGGASIADVLAKLNA